jgi:hypothetical protein
METGSRGKLECLLLADAVEEVAFYGAWPLVSQTRSSLALSVRPSVAKIIDWFS